MPAFAHARASPRGGVARNKTRPATK
uniref:Uncharacterized protein n=1 Tax=Arundo donax TaxID=35708 RepID=A0A0A9BUM4_ARUDO